LAATPSNVPAAATALIGRSSETIDVVRLLRDGRLVTLTGSGGCGNTRLAQHAATLLAPEFTGRVWWVELASVTDPSDVIDRVRSSISAVHFPSADAVGALTEHLKAQGRVLRARQRRTRPRRDVIARR
jgi:predicted ATPase